MVVSGLLSRRGGVLEESVLHFRVLPNDIDFNLHLNDGRYVSFMGLGRAHLLTRTGVLRKALARRWAPVVGGVIVRYRREIRTFERFTLRSRIIGWDEKWIYVEHRLEVRGSLRAIAYARGVLRSREGAVPTAVVMRLAGLEAASPELPELVHDWPELPA